jgi:hypothetical protein
MPWNSRRTAAHQGICRSEIGNSRDHRPDQQERSWRKGPAVRKYRHGFPRPDECLWQRKKNVHGPGRPHLDDDPRNRRPLQTAVGAQRGPAGQIEAPSQIRTVCQLDARRPKRQGECQEVVMKPPDITRCPSSPAGRKMAVPLLPCPSSIPKIPYRHPQCRHVPHAGLRTDPDGHALA